MSDASGNIGVDENVQVFYRLKLFIAGASTISTRAIHNLKNFLEDELKGNFDLEIVDIRHNPIIAVNENITALPVLIKYDPSPKKMLVGDMSDTTKIRRGLGMV